MSELSEIQKLTEMVEGFLGDRWTTVASRLNGKMAVISSFQEYPEARFTPNLFVELYDVDEESARTAVAHIDNYDFTFVTPPSLMASTSEDGGRTYDVAPTLVTLYIAGAHRVLDDMCFHAHDGELGMATLAVEAISFGETGKDLGLESAYISPEAFYAWLSEMNNSEHEILPTSASTTR